MELKEVKGEEMGKGMGTEMVSVLMGMKDAQVGRDGGWVFGRGKRVDGMVLGVGSRKDARSLEGLVGERWLAVKGVVGFERGMGILSAEVPGRVFVWRGA